MPILCHSPGGITHWNQTTYIPNARVFYPRGRGVGNGPLIDDIGIDKETMIDDILYRHGINTSSFSREALSCIPSIPWKVPNEEIQNRKDLRHLCVFTVDPPGASDLDDALSIEVLPNNAFRVGVHIADVSHFVVPNSPLDVESRTRSTSVYLPSSHQKFAMLPARLTDYVASLHPGEDKLAFTIFWEMNSQGRILGRWIGKSVVRSCTKLSYQQTQQILNGGPFKDRPELHGKFRWDEVMDSVKKLYRLSTVLRTRKLKENMSPPRQRRLDSELLVETYMVLANTTAAEAIHAACPASPLLQRAPLYTQFTSPLRRYLDIIVHRALSESIGIKNALSTTTKNLESVVADCHGKKVAVANVERTIQMFEKSWNQNKSCRQHWRSRSNKYTPVLFP